MIINQNIPALHSYNALSSGQREISKAMARLSTGLRVNSAADDAAGLAISEKMRAQAYGLEQAARNVQDGISMTQTAEGALSETHSILQRMRELSVQAANDSLTAEDRSYIQLEVGQLRDEIDRIASTTQFNRKKLLDGSAGAVWSSDRLSTAAVIRGGLTSKDQFGQKVVAEGNYRIEITSNPGQAEIQKSNIFSAAEEVPEEIEATPTPPLAEPEVTIDLEAITAGAGWSFDSTSNILTISGEGTYKITGTSAVGIHVTANASILLSGANIDVSATSDACAFEVAAGAAVNLYLEGANSLVSGQNRAGLEVPEGASITITSASGDGSTAGSLVASGGNHAAGIGGQGSITLGVDGNAGSITINGGTITANGGGGDAISEGGAGIGGGNTGGLDGGGTITINGGSVTATGGAGSAGIGSAFNGAYPAVTGDGGMTVTITGGTVKATGGTSTVGEGGAVIGGGAFSDSGAIIVAGGSVTATGGTGAADIGSGFRAITTNVVEGNFDVRQKTLDRIKQFHDSNGAFLLSSPQRLTIYQGDGTSASVTLYGADTLADVAKKINDAIAGTLGQGAHVDEISKFCTLSDGTAGTSESIYTRAPVYDETEIDGYERYTTMLIRSAIPGAEGELKFSGDESLLKALGLSTILESRESEFTVNIYDAHSGEAVGGTRKTTGSTLCRAITESVDIRFDPLADIDAVWNESAKRFDFRSSEGVYRTYVHLADNTTIFQTGANEGEDFAVLFGDASSSALGLDSLLVTSRETASRSITLIDGAIDRVSRMRALLGAYQNRLEHTTANLTVASTNTAASESRIRDADMAKEMMQFTKLNILTQAGNSMLAQANQMPQNILALLR